MNYLKAKIWVTRNGTGGCYLQWQCQDGWFPQLPLSLSIAQPFKSSVLRWLQSRGRRNSHMTLDVQMQKRTNGGKKYAKKPTRHKPKKSKMGTAKKISEEASRDARTFIPTTAHRLCKSFATLQGDKPRSFNAWHSIGSAWLGSSRYAVLQKTCLIGMPCHAMPIIWSGLIGRLDLVREISKKLLFNLRRVAYAKCCRYTGWADDFIVFNAIQNGCNSVAGCKKSRGKKSL